MATILITGAGPNGITGTRLKEILQDRYDILSPSSKELNLIETKEVDRYFQAHDIDYIVHSAVVSPSRGHDSSKEEKEVEDNLRMFFNLARHKSEVKKIFYFGSGAEFDKTLSIENFKEDDYYTRLPQDKYGFIKYVLNNIAIKSDNIYNLRLFGTINPNEPYSRNVISNLCAKAALGLPLNLRRDCIFSFVDIDDVANFIDYGINHELKFHDYNMSVGIFRLSEIAEMINRYFCNTENTVQFQEEGLNKEYSASNKRLIAEFNNLTPILTSLKKVFDHMNDIKENIDIAMIDSRWAKSKTTSVK